MLYYIRAKNKFIYKFSSKIFDFSSRNGVLKMRWNPLYVKEQIHINTLFSLFTEHKSNGFHFPGETHNFWECLYVIKGSACISGDDKVYELSAGDLVFHKPMELHKFYIDHKNGADLLIFSFNMTGPLSEYFKDKVFRLNDEQQQIVSTLLNFVKRQAAHAGNDGEHCKEDQLLRLKNSSPVYLQRIVTFLYALFLSLGESGNISHFSTVSDALVFQQAVQYMTEHIYGHPTVSEIAKYCFLSESGLKRLFTKYAGISIHKYFLTLKFKTAARLLQDGMSVREVSEKLNFSSQSYFSVSFKREIGINPSKF